MYPWLSSEYLEGSVVGGGRGTCAARDDGEYGAEARFEQETITASYDRSIYRPVIIDWLLSKPFVIPWKLESPCSCDSLAKFL